jgi:hypothetical protein
MKEVLMAEVVEQAEASEPAAGAVDAAPRPARMGNRVMDLVFGAQKAMLEEVVFVSNEMLDRAQTEIHLFSELASKLAEAHSVKDIKAMSEQCSQHQIDFVRRDSERLFRHGERLIETASKLLHGRAPG